MKPTLSRRAAAIALAATTILAACGGSDSGGSDGGGSDATNAAGSSGDTAATDGGDESGGGGDVTLRVLVHQNPPMVEFMEQFNSTFESEHPGTKIDMSVVKADELSTVTQTRMTAGDVDVIDIFGFANGKQDYMPDTVTPPNWQTLIEGGQLMDLTDQDFVKNYDETSLADAGSYNGKVYSVNLGRVSYSGMFVNNKVLSDAGVEIPKTWSDLVAACDTVKAAGNDCMVVGGADGWPVFVGASGLLGASFPDQQEFVKGLWTGDVKWTDPDSVAMYEKFKIYAQDMLAPGVTGLTHDAAIAKFAAGGTAFSPTGVWQAPSLEEAGPDFEWTYVPFPGSDDEADNQYLFGKYDQGWAIAEQSPNKDAAIEYLAAFSEPDNYQAFVNAVGFIPTQPTATLDSTLGTAVAPYLENYKVGFEQFWVEPTGAGQWANGSQAASWFTPFNEWDDATKLATQSQADLEAGELG